MAVPNTSPGARVRRQAAMPLDQDQLEIVGTGSMGSTFLRWRFAPDERADVLDHGWNALGRRVSRRIAAGISADRPNSTCRCGG